MDDPEFRRYVEIYAKVHNNSVASSVNDQTAPERETIAFCEPELVNQNIYHVSSDAFSILFTSEFSTPWIHRISLQSAILNFNSQRKHGFRNLTNKILCLRRLYMVVDTIRVCSPNILSIIFCRMKKPSSGTMQSHTRSSRSWDSRHLALLSRANPGVNQSPW